MIYVECPALGVAAPELVEQVRSELGAFWFVVSVGVEGHVLAVEVTAAIPPGTAAFAVAGSVSRVLGADAYVRGDSVGFERAGGNDLRILLAVPAEEVDLAALQSTAGRCYEVQPGLIAFVEAPTMETVRQLFSTVPFQHRMVTFGRDEVPNLPCISDGVALLPVSSPSVVAASSLPPAQQGGAVGPELAKALVQRLPPPKPTEGDTEVVALHSPAIHCKSCVAKIARGLKKAASLEPLHDFVIDLETKTTYAINTTQDVVASVLAEAGLPAEPRPISFNVLCFSVTGMTCKSCSARIKRTLRPRRTQVDHETGVLQVWGYPEEDTSALRESVMSKVLELKKFGITFDAVQLEDTVAPSTFFVSASSPRASLVNSITCPTPGPPDDSLAEKQSQPPPAPLEAQFDEASFIVKGMTCASCAGRIEDHLTDLPSVRKAIVNFSTSVARVEYARSFGANGVVKEIVSLGYQAVTLDEGCGACATLRKSLTHEEDIAKNWLAAKRAMMLAFPLMLVMMVGMRIPFIHHCLTYELFHGVTVGPVIQIVVATPVVFVYGHPFFRRAITAVQHCTFTMDVLVALGVSAAYFASVIALLQSLISGTPSSSYSFHTAASLIAFMLLGKYLEYHAKSRTTEALLSLLDMQPKTALLIAPSGEEREVDVQQVQKGDLVRIITGASVPVDGEVVEGAISVDESMITGESIPRPKESGEEVAGGTVCVDGSAVVRATRVGGETSIAQILKLVNDAQTNKAPVQKYADRAAGVFVPCVVSVSVLVFVVWALLGVGGVYPSEWRKGSSPLTFAVEFLIATLVIACPCAMGLATPTAVMVGTGVGAKHGIFIKGGETLETAASVRVVLFDKTGTLSKGEVAVTSATYHTPRDASMPLTPVKALGLIAAVEQQSQHPIAKAIVAYAKDKGAVISGAVTQHSTAPGKGVSAVVDGVEVKVGSPKWIGTHHTSTGGETAIAAMVGGHVVYHFGLHDEMKPEAAAVVAHLQREGCEVYMVTGDCREAALHMAKAVGIDENHVYAEVLPGDKAEIVKGHQNPPEVADGSDVEMGTVGLLGGANGGAPGVVCFVGDGINDAPALVQADVGVALGAGTSVAIDAADAVLARNNLRDVATLLHLSRRTMRRIKWNFVWAFGYNLAAIPVASGVFFPLLHTQLPPVVGGLAMIASSLCVLSSSLLLRRYTPPTI